MITAYAILIGLLLALGLFLFVKPQWADRFLDFLDPSIEDAPPKPKPARTFDESRLTCPLCGRLWPSTEQRDACLALGIPSGSFRDGERFVVTQTPKRAPKWLSPGVWIVMTSRIVTADLYNQRPNHTVSYGVVMFNSHNPQHLNISHDTLRKLINEGAVQVISAQTLTEPPFDF